MVLGNKEYDHILRNDDGDVVGAIWHKGLRYERLYPYRHNGRGWERKMAVKYSTFIKGLAEGRYALM